MVSSSSSSSSYATYRFVVLSLEVGKVCKECFEQFLFPFLHLHEPKARTRWGQIGHVRRTDWTRSGAAQAAEQSPSGSQRLTTTCHNST
jgi:hypothetical protein